MAEVALETTANIPSGTSVTVTVYEDIGNDNTGSATDPNGKSYDNSASQSIGDGTNRYVLTGFNADLTNDEHWAELSFDHTDDSLTASVQSVAVSKLDAPSSVSATVNSDDSIDVSWTDQSTDEQSFEVQVNRDGNGWVSPSGGPSSVSSTSEGTTGTGYSTNYNPNSDTAYEKQVGVDSEFNFRVRAKASDHADSNWVQTGAVYTTPIPPHAPSVSRSDGSSINISWANQSDIEDGVEVQYREDPGSGYGAWTTAGTTAAGATSYSDSTLPDDVRRQWRIRTVASDGDASLWAYTDYGNQNNVYFEDSFEDNDLAEWSSTSLSDADSGVVNNTATPDTGISGSEDGSYHLRLDASDYVYKDLGDLSGESDVVIKSYVAVGSMESGSEDLIVEWYDGSSWQQLRRYSWEYNEQGWVESTVPVPDSYLSASNFVRFRANGSGGGDHSVVDRVVVSDVLHEFTSPAAASGFSADTTVEDEITLSWTENATFEDRYYADVKRTSDSSYTTDATLPAGSTGHTYTGLDDGERYDLSPVAEVDQYRRGSKTADWQTRAAAAATSLLPAPTNLSVEAVGTDSVDLSWVDNHDYGHVDVEYKPADTTTWQTADDNVAIGTGAYTITGLRNGEQYDARVLAATEHTRTEDN